MVKSIYKIIQLNTLFCKHWRCHKWSLIWKLLWLLLLLILNNRVDHLRLILLCVYLMVQRSKSQLLNHRINHGLLRLVRIKDKLFLRALVQWAGNMHCHSGLVPLILDKLGLLKLEEVSLSLRLHRSNRILKVCEWTWRKPRCRVTSCLSSFINNGMNLRARERLVIDRLCTYWYIQATCAY